MIDVESFISAVIALVWLISVLVRKAFVFNFFGAEFHIRREKKPIRYWAGISFISLFGFLASLAAFRFI